MVLFPKGADVIMEPILVLFPTEPEHRRQLEAAAPGAKFFYGAECVSEEVLRQVRVVLGNPKAELLEKLPALGLLQLNSAGVGFYAKPGALRDGVILTNASGAYGPGIAEHMLGLALTLLKKLHRYRDNQRERLWHDEGKVTSLLGAQVLVVGLGDLGREFAKRADALGASVTGIKRTPGEKPSYVKELYTLEKLDECLPKADVVLLSLPETPETRGLFDAKRLSRMKEGAILLNAGRGNAIDTPALCDAVESGHLRGAGLDVTDPEPLPPDHRVWGVKDIVITPHVSGGFHLPYTHDRIVQICVENLRRFLAGEELLHRVNREAGY